MARFGSSAQEAKNPEKKVLLESKCSLVPNSQTETCRRLNGTHTHAGTSDCLRVPIISPHLPYLCLNTLRHTCHQKMDIFFTTILELQSVLNGSFGQFVCIPSLINICFDGLKPGERAGKEASIEHDSQ